MSDPIETTIVAGDNQVRLSCHEQRQIEGVVRARASERSGDLAVRCAGSDEPQFVINSHFFYISCNVNTASVEYQIGESGSWRSVPIATASDPALVEIDL